MASRVCGRRLTTQDPAAPTRRVGDLVMVLDAIAMVRAMAPDATINLVVGSWNRSLAGLIQACTSRNTGCAVDGARESGAAVEATVQRARAWRREAYDLAINFEPDIRSNLLMALSGARRRAGFVSGGGGAVLTDAIAPDPHAHIAENAKALVARAFARTGAPRRTFLLETAYSRGRTPQGGRARRYA
jgi:ADP-heptose:LPS heptosyltransferase